MSAKSLCRWTVACLANLLLAIAATAADAPAKPPFDGPVRHPRIATADYLHLAARLSFDWDKGGIRGQVTHRFRALERGMRSIVLDAVSIEVSAVRDGDGNELASRGYDDRLEIDLAEPLELGAESSVTIDYSCRPKKGAWFISPIDEHPDRPRQVWTQGESENTRHWVPCFDSPAERLTSELELRVPAELDALANGALVGETAHDDGTKTVHWRLDKEHVPYLICFVVGRYERLEDSWDGIPLRFWHYPGDAERARVAFERTADMMQYFSSRFGRYPWNKYDQIVVRDFVAGGMENTTLTVLTDTTLHDAGEEPHVSSLDLVAHELAHQWFGDLVTCRDWSDLWLNESFATFCADLYTEHALGRDEAQMERLSHLETYMREDASRYRRPLSCRTYRSPDDMFDSHSYPKGGLIIEMLRQMLGDERFDRGIRLYLERHAHQSVETPQLRRALEDANGVSLAWFFDQWVHRGGHPEIAVEQRWDARARKLTLRVQQTQIVDALTPLFRLPVEIGIHGADGSVRIEKIEIQGADETFGFDAPERPSFVTFDHRRVLLAAVTHEKPLDDWVAQLRRGEDPLVRIAAVDALRDRLEQSDDADVRDRLIERLAAEPFWGLRRALVRALAVSHHDASADAIASAMLEARHPRVREAAAQALGRMRRAHTTDALARAAGEDRSDWVRAAALRSLRIIDVPKALPIAQAALDQESHRERVRRAAIDVIVDAKDIESVDRILALAAPGSRREVRAAALRALSRLAPNDDRVFAAVAKQIDAPLPAMRRTVIDAVAAFDTKDARRVLEERRDRESEKPLIEAIDRAIARIGQPTRVDELARELEALRERSEELERRLDSLEERKARKF